MSVRARANRLTLFSSLSLSLSFYGPVVSKLNQPVIFDFEKLDIYEKPKLFNSGIWEFIRKTTLGMLPEMN
jgi:hypothetical protein